jgi:F-type H+-transporting ATPase subunit b
MVAFLVVLVVMTRFVVPRIRTGMQARQDAINQALAAARDAEERCVIAQVEAEAIMAAARREARTIIEQARRMSDQMIAEGRRAGIEEYRWESARMQRELRRRTAAPASLSVDG